MKFIANIILILCISSFLNLAKGQYPEYNSLRGTNLDSIFPIDNIIQIKVNNISGVHILNQKQLASLKTSLKKAKFVGGLLIKPGHIILELKLKDKSIAKAGFVYAPTGQIHFEEGIDKFKNKFYGTFILPNKLNFDNY